MTEYQKRMRKHADRIYKEYEEAHELVEDWLDKQNAPTIIKDAFRKCSRRPTVTWA